MTSRTTRRFGLLAAGLALVMLPVACGSDGTPSRSRVQAALVTSGLPRTEARCATKQLFTVLSGGQLRNLAESGSGALDDKATTALSTALATCMRNVSASGNSPSTGSSTPTTQPQTAPSASKP